MIKEFFLKKRHPQINNHKFVHIHKSTQTNFKHSHLQKKFWGKTVKLKIPLIIIANIFIIFILFFSPIFKVKNIDFYRQSLSVNITDIESFLMERVFNRSIFMISTKSLTEEARNNFKQWKNISIKKTFPNNLEVTIEHFTPYANLKINRIESIPQPENNTEITVKTTTETKTETIENTPETKIITENYVINELGNISTSEINEEPKINIIYQDQLNNDVIMGSNIIEPEHMKNIQLILDKLLNNYDFLTKEIVYFNNAKEAHFDIFQFKIWFDFTQDLNPQFKKLDKALLELEKTNLEYIDLRIKNRIIYKNKK